LRITSVDLLASCLESSSPDFSRVLSSVWLNFKARHLHHDAGRIMRPVHASNITEESNCSFWKWSGTSETAVPFVGSAVSHSGLACKLGVPKPHRMTASIIANTLPANLDEK